MAKKGLKGLVNRLIEGKEKSEGYARASLPSNRWELFWDIFKGRFGKLVIINLLMLLFFLPLFALIFYRYITIMGYGLAYPFAQGFGVGYQAPFSMVGYSENIIFNVNTAVYILMPIALMIAAIGVSGGAYVIRNMVWTEGTFVSNDFWRGISLNYKKILVISLLFSVMFYVTFCVNALFDQLVAVGQAAPWLITIVKIITYFVFGFYSVMTAHMITMTVTYDYKLRHLFKNSFLFTLGLLPHNVFFGLLALLPFILLTIGGIITVLIGVAIILVGFSYVMLIWTDFSQWAYDNYINERIGAKKNRGIYEKVNNNATDEAIKKYRQQVAIANYSALSSRPVKPITDDELQLAELPTSFSRSDIQKLNQSRQAIYEDNERYIAEHKKEFEAINEEKKSASELEEERQKRIEKAKRELAKRKKR